MEEKKVGRKKDLKKDKRKNDRRIEIEGKR